jgi:predicted PurR-regulated permease PerM
MPRTIEISHRTILFVLGVLIAGWLILQIRDILYLLFISFILTTALRPFVDALTKYRIPRPLAIIIIYLILIGIVAGVIGSVIPQVAAQTAHLAQTLPKIAQRVLPSFNIDPGVLSSQLAPVTQNIFQFGVQIFNNMISFVTIFVFTFYFLLGRNHLEQTMSKIFTKNQTKEILGVIVKVEEKLGAWARGQSMLMLIIGLTTYVGLTLLQIDYALPLAVFAGLLEMVPMAGPIISAVPAILVGLTVSPLLGLSVAALYFVIQQFENHLIVPQVMKRSVGLSPVLVIIAFMIGARFEGVIGAILAVPAILVAQVVIGHFLEKREENNSATKTS